MPFEWIAALRFLREGRMQTIFIVAGVSVGIAVIVFMSALLTGLQANLTRRVLTAQGHIALQTRDEIARVLGHGAGTLDLPIVCPSSEHLARLGALISGERASSGS